MFIDTSTWRDLGKHRVNIFALVRSTIVIDLNLKKCDKIYQGC